MTFTITPLAHFPPPKGSSSSSSRGPPPPTSLAPPPLSSLQLPAPSTNLDLSLDLDLSGLKSQTAHLANPPANKERSATPPWRKRKVAHSVLAWRKRKVAHAVAKKEAVAVAEHLQLAVFWRCDLLEKCTREEVLGIKFLRPSTARQRLGIDIYAARGLARFFKVRTIETLARVVRSQTLLRGEAYVLKMLLEAILSPLASKALQECIGCLLPKENMEAAEKEWDKVHPGTVEGEHVRNDVAITKVSVGFSQTLFLY